LWQKHRGDLQHSINKSRDLRYQCKKCMCTVRYTHSVIASEKKLLIRLTHTIFFSNQVKGSYHEKHETQVHLKF
jgi:hypothetical protein